MPNRDPEKRRAYHEKWMAEHPDRWRELSKVAMRTWRKRHPDVKRAREKAYREAHPEVKRASDLRYRTSHPEIRKVIDNRRRGRMRAAAGSFTQAEWVTLVAEYGGRCAYCGREAPLQVEHRIPLAKGGSNFIENILPACARCNARKHVLDDVAFRARLAQQQPID